MPDELIAAMAPFGGGMGSSGQVCGTLSGALAVIGYTLGKTSPEDKDHKLLWKISYKMVRQFDEITKEYGGNNCADIAQINWKDMDSVKTFYKDPDSTRKNCVQVIQATSDYLYDLIQENFPQDEGAE